LSITIQPPTPGSITPTGGTTPQSVINGSPFTPLQALLKDTNGNPINGATVTCTAPTTGTTGTFAAGLYTFTTTTNASGIATTAFTANSTKSPAGTTYTVTAA